MNKRKSNVKLVSVIKTKLMSVVFLNSLLDIMMEGILYLERGS